ncbi:FAD-dependent oxidoreductase [Streptomyces sp. NBC_00210]|uniref:flavin monoamine oxidase family protein n=1 Tax=unclassified Streptomyces TaxID=2593676 RepID=UPI00324CF04E
MTKDRRLPQHSAPGKLSRRNVLKAGALSTVAASIALPSALAAGDGAAPHYDAIVIGAGFAGVTAARELRAKGLRTLVLEARNRIGGRIWTDTFVGQPIEFGAQWVGSSQPLVNAELQRYGIAKTSGQPPTRAIMPTPTGPKPFSPLEVDEKQSELLQKLFEGSREYFPRPTEPLYARDRVAQIDGLSLRDRLNQLKLSPQDESWINGTTSGQSGGSSSYGGLTALTQWWALCGHNIDGWYGAMAYRIGTGMSGLLKAMLDDAAVELRLSSPVASVADDGKQVTVTTKSGAKFTAKTTVVAVPVNVWKNITFRPGLPAAHTAATTQGVGVPNSRKLWMHVSGLTDRVVVHGAEGDTFTTVLSQGQVPGGQLMLAFNSLPALDVTSRTAVQSALRKVLPEASVIEVKAQDWGRDKYSLGGWAMRRPNQLTTQFPAIQQPSGRLAFASGDIASGWNGFVEGAIESGQRAAQQAIAASGSARGLATAA